jgi:hypothetical protein
MEVAQNCVFWRALVLATLIVWIELPKCRYILVHVLSKYNAQILLCK